ncbi:MAG TPA: ATP-binding protein [Pseudonocardiaceae bacterium]
MAWLTLNADATWSTGPAHPAARSPGSRRNAPISSASISRAEPAGQLDDIVLAVSEAVSNAAEHAYWDRPPGMIELSAGVEITPGGQRRVTLVVRDHGHWRPAPRDDEGRRRGIPLMRACMDSVTIAQPDNRAGTRVVLRSRAVPPAS